MLFAVSRASLHVDSMLYDCEWVAALVSTMISNITLWTRGRGCASLSILVWLSPGWLTNRSEVMSRV